MSRRGLWDPISLATCAALVWGLLHGALALASQGYLQQGLWHLAASTLVAPIGTGGLRVAALVLAGWVAALLLGWARRRGARVPRLPAPLVRALRRPLPVAALGLAALWLGLRGLAAIPAAPASAPPVMLVIIDTLRADHLGVYGSARPTSPHIDQLARQSVVFRNAWSVASWTTPSIAAMITSRYPRELGIVYPPLPFSRSALSVAELFREHGYATGAVISHLYLSAGLGFGQGFQEWNQSNARGERYVSSPSVIDLAVDFVDRHRAEPFFLLVHLFDPHAMYLEHDPWRFDPGYAGPITPDMSYGELQQLAPHLGARDWRHLAAVYDSEVRFTDEHLGRLLQHLRDVGLFDRMGILLAADHGEGLGDRNHEVGHGKHLHRELTHVPLVIKPPGRFAPHAVDTPVSTIDVAPTLASLAGLPVPESFRGRPLALDPGGVEARPILMDGGDGKSALIVGHLKLMHSRQGDSLYDLAADPDERADLAPQEGDRAARLASQLEVSLARLPPAPPTGKRASPFSPEEIERLRALGYAQ